MLDVNTIVANLELVAEGCEAKNVRVDLDRIAALNVERKSSNARCDALRHEKKSLGPKIQAAKKAGEDAAELIARSSSIKAEEKEAAARVREVQEELDALLLTVPNLPHPDVPRGSEANNRVVRSGGERRSFDFEAADHVALCERFGIDTNKRGVKVSGSGFACFKGPSARLARKLIGWFLDTHTTENGYTEVSVPLLVNRRTMTGTGQLPKLEDDMYHLDREDLFLIPTAEVPVTNLHQDEILAEKELPLCYTGYTPCFRREAGAYGADTRGLMRLHQFDKVELVRTVHPDTSEADHELMVGQVEALLQALELEYRVLELATGDLSFAASRCYDLEVYAPVTGRWFECSSVSNFRDFQARRANIRFRGKDGKVHFCHTLNGSGLALPRIILCLLETHQQADGTIRVPAALQPVLGEVIEA